MKNNFILLGLLAVFLVLGSCSKDTLDLEVAEKLDDKKSKLQNREFVSESITPNYIGNSEYRQMQIYTPPGYDKHSSKTYPVVYLLHGLPFSEKSFVSPELWDSWIGPPMPFQWAPDFPEDGFRAWIDRLIETGEIKPMIIVMPDATTNMYGFSMYTNSMLNGGFEDFIANDLINYIDSKYKTNASNSGRAVVGTSQGGYGAIKLGMLHPDKFGVVASHTGLIYIEGVLAMGKLIADENPGGFTGPGPTKFLTSAMYAFSAAWSPNLNNPPFMVDIPFDDSGNLDEVIGNKWLEHDVFTMLDKPGNLSNMNSLNGIYLDAGNQDELTMNLMAFAFDAKLTALGVEHDYQTFDGGHFSHLFSRLEISLKFCSDRMD